MYRSLVEFVGELSQKMDYDRSNGNRCQWRRKRTRRRKITICTSAVNMFNMADAEKSSSSNWFSSSQAKINKDEQVPLHRNKRSNTTYLETSNQEAPARRRVDEFSNHAQHDLNRSSIKFIALKQNDNSRQFSLAQQLTSIRQSDERHNFKMQTATKCRRKPTKSNNINYERASRLALVLLMVTSCCLDLISCQMRPSFMSDQSPSPFLPSNSPSSSSQSPLVGNMAFEPAEARAIDQPLRPQSIDQLVNSFLKYQANQNSRRAQTLPLNNNQRMPLPNQQQQQQPQQLNNQFAGMAPNQPFAANRRPNLPGNAPNNNQLGFVSSSPATPYLPLSRFVNQQPQQPANQPQLASNQNRNIFNQPQPINTIPLGLGALNGNSANANRVAPIPPANRFVQVPTRPNSQQQQNPVRNVQATGGNPIWASLPSSTPVSAPLATIQQNNNLQPLTGFSPSGPPPLSSNNALVVVQSPANSASNQQSAAAQPDLIENKTSPSTTIATATEADRSDASSESDDKSSQATTTVLSFVTTNNPKQATSDSALAVSEPSPSVKDDANAVNKDDQTTPAKDNWNPVENFNRTAANKNKVNLSPSPDIVTVPPGYNPDSPSSGPQNFDISVSAKMGGNSQQQPAQPADVSQNSARPSEMSVAETSSSAPDISAPQTSFTIPSAAPTAVTTIIWSPPSETASSTSSAIQPTRASDSMRSQSTSTIAVAYQPQPIPNRIRDNSLNEEPVRDSNSGTDNGVVYGKPQAKDSKPAPPVSPSPVLSQASIESSVPASGRPFIEPVQIDNQVRPFLAPPGGGQQRQSQTQQQAVLKSNHGQSPLFQPSRPLHSNGAPPLHVGSGFTITANGNQTMPLGDIQDYVAGQPPIFVAPSSTGSQTSDTNNEPTISAQGGQDPANFDLGNGEFASSQANNRHQTGAGQAAPPEQTQHQQASTTPQPPRIRKPTFKPKPPQPEIRIDSCIVGDDSSCSQEHNERCVTEYGITSCHCKPGYARLSQLREQCKPVSSLQLSFKIDKLSDDRRLVYNHTLTNSSSEEYQYLEFETLQATAAAFQPTPLGKRFMGTRVNKFFDRKGKVWANVSVNFEGNLTKSDHILNATVQDLIVKVSQAKPMKPLGDSTIMLDGNHETVSRLVDVNECASKELNDCSKHAVCTNNFGGFQCQCLPGYEDKYLTSEDKSKHGRVCLGCSASYCSNRGECSIVDGQKQCKCRANFIGDRCDYNSEILVLIIGCSLVCMIILIFTMWGLYFVNRRWKQQDSQPKLDAMSATSGLTYNYINSSTNSLMSPTSRALSSGALGGAGIHRSAAGGHQTGANYGHRFGAALVGGGRGAQHYNLDQQAIIGSTSSGSSAASQPIGCNPYAAGQYQYEDAGLLIAPASTGSSEQTSPSDNSYRGIMAASGQQANHSHTMMSQLAANAYTLSGHHHHHHHHPAHHHHQHHQPKQQQQLSQFNPSAEYRTMAHCVPGNGNSLYAEQNSRWRTLQQESAKQSALVGYYLVRNQY